MGIASDFIGDRAAEPVHRVAGTDLFYYTAGLEPDARFNYRFTGNLEDSLRDSLNPRRPHPSDPESCRGRLCQAGPLHLRDPPRTPGDDWARPFGEPMRSWPPSFR